MGKASRKKRESEVGSRKSEVGWPPDLRPPTSDRRIAPLAAALALVVIAVFSQVVTHDFINYDDPDYVSANPIVQRGLTVDGIRFAFTSLAPAYWQPLTWLTLELDTSIGGARPAVFLVVNVLMHAAAVVLLFLVLQRTTGARWPSAFAAAIWGVHPLRVESVAWIAERKDVLSTLLFVLTLLVYARFVEQRTAARYIAVVIVFALALMAKPMVVTLPVALLLFDVWPLERRPTIKDKVPLAILAVAVIAITFAGQRAAIAATLPLSIRISNAVVSSAAYLGKMLLPINLAVVYPYSYSIAAWKVAGCALLLIFITAAVIYVRKAHWIAGWFWYLVTLVPVVGIVQAGPQSMADRFTYIPSIGLITAAAFSIPYAAVGILATVICAALSIVNLRYWKDSTTLFAHAIAVTNDNTVAQLKLGDAYAAQNRLDDANREYADAVRTSNGGALPLAVAGTALVQQKRYAEAVPLLQRAAAADPSMAAVRQNLAIATNGAYEAHLNSGADLSRDGKLVEAEAHMREAMRLAPSAIEPRIYLALVLAQSGKKGEAVTLATEAMRMDANASNEIFTRALHLPPNPRNLEQFVGKMRSSS